MDRGQTIATDSLDRPVRVEVGLRTVRVAAVVPCFNRPQDLAALARDLAECRLTADLPTGPARVQLSVLIVDNASDPPLDAPDLPDRIASRLVRLAQNTGGSGGYNAGMAVALEAEPDYLWLVDSDARVEPDTLARLVAAAETDSSIVAAGPVLTDTETGRVQEIGGRFDRETGRFGPLSLKLGADQTAPITCDYVAACCALIRAEAARRTGLMPEVFLNADDVEWCMRLARDADGRVAVLPGATAAHPRFDRFGTLPRYFGARNAFGPIDALGLGRGVRFRRAMRETLRAVNQQLMNRPDLAALHTRGLRDAAAGRLRDLPADLPKIEPMRPFDELGAALASLDAERETALAIEWPADVVAADRQTVRRALAEAGFDVDAAARAPTRSLAALLRRVIAGPRYRLAVVPAKGSPAHWFVGRTLVELAPNGFALRESNRALLLARAAGSVARGSWHAARIALRPRRVSPLPAPDAARSLAPISAKQTLSLSVIVLSYNRKDALLETLARLREGATTRDAEIIVVDNASTDGSTDAVREHAPWATPLALETNQAIAGFNRGVEHASGDLVLILDDDARPDNDSLAAAIAALTERPELAAATLMPFHPETRCSEWPFAARLAGPRDDWPVMGCCNLVRRDVWRAVGGYDESFFLYRNDVELALKILATGRGVRFDPAWRCEHDSPAAAAKSARWCELATRNWIWTARRHGRGPRAALGLVAGWLWAHRLAGLSPSRHLAVLRGASQGLTQRPARIPAHLRPEGRAFAELLRLRFG